MAERTHKSDAFAAIHETADGLNEIGAIEKRIMREFDEACLIRLPNSTGQKTQPS